MDGFNGILDTIQEEDLRQIDNFRQISRWKEIVSRFKG